MPTYQPGPHFCTGVVFVPIKEPALSPTVLVYIWVPHLYSKFYEFWPMSADMYSPLSIQQGISFSPGNDLSKGTSVSGLIGTKIPHWRCPASLNHSLLSCLLYSPDETPLLLPCWCFVEWGWWGCQFLWFTSLSLPSHACSAVGSASVCTHLTPSDS